MTRPPAADTDRLDHPHQPRTPLVTPTPPNFDRRPTRYDPDHSVSDLDLPAVWPPPRTPAPEPGRPWWVRLIRLAARLARWLLRRGKQ